MLDQYKGKNGKLKLAHDLEEHELVKDDERIAKRLAELSEVGDLAPGGQLFVEKEFGKRFLYFVLSGRLALSFEGKKIYEMEEGESVGEFPILVRGSKHTVTVSALEHTIFARVSDEDFLVLAKEYPEVWQNMARMLALRLRGRNSRPISQNVEDLTPKDLLRMLINAPFRQGWGVIIAIGAVIGGVVTIAYQLGRLAK